MTRNPASQEIRRRLMRMQVCVSDTTDRIEDLAEAGGPIRKRPSARTSIEAKATGARAGAAMLHAAVAMLAHPGVMIGEQKLLAEIVQRASEKDESETILDMCALVRKSRSRMSDMPRKPGEEVLQKREGADDG